MGFPVRLEKTSPADSDNPSAGAEQIRNLKGFIEDYFNISDTVSYTASPFTEESLGRVNVREYPYNAVGDGVTDDTAAFNSAIASGSPVFVPSGTYLLSALDPITASLRLYGVGRSSILKFNTTSDAIHLHPAASLQEETYHIHHLAFDNETNVPASFVRNQNGINVRLDHLYFSSCAATYVIDNENGYGLKVADCVFSDVTGSGVRLRDNGSLIGTEYSYAATIDSCDFTRISVDAIEVEGCQTLNIGGGTVIESCGGKGINAGTAGGPTVQSWNMNLVGVYFESNTGVDIDLQSANSFFCATTLIGCTFVGTPTIALGTGSQVTIMGSTCSGGHVCTITGTGWAKATLIDSLNFIQSGSFGWETVGKSGQLNVQGFGATGNGITDDTAAIQAAIDAAVAANTSLYFPVGTYLVTSTLTAAGVTATSVGSCLYLVGGGMGHDAVRGTIIKWGGTDNLSNTLMKLDAPGRLIIRDMTLDGSSKVGKVLWVKNTPGTSYSGYGWRFENVNFWYPKSTGYGFYIEGTTDLARMSFTSCHFVMTTGSTGYYTRNQNSLNQSFYNCGFYAGAYGLDVSGDCHLFGCELVLHEEADINLYIHNAITMTGCWSEQSKRVISAEYSSLYASATLTGCTLGSYPWSYWKLDEANRTQPTNDYNQWGTIYWDRPGALNLIGCTFNDPFLGQSTGAVSPQVSQYPGVNMPNQTLVRVNNIGSFSQLAQAAPITEGIIHTSVGVSTGAEHTTQRHGRYASTLGIGKSTLQLYWGNVQEWTMTGATEIAIDGEGAEIGDTFTLILKQDGAGGHALTWTVAPKLVGGVAFTPTVAVGARSMIMLMWDGTYWNEMYRGLDLK